MSVNTTNLFGRPPIGFVVEGRGEYDCYPSIVSRILSAKGFKLPRVNAGGYGNIVRHLGDQLNALVLADSPFHVIVTVDLKEVLDEGLYNTCAQLCASLEKQAQDWLANARHDSRLHPLPDVITVVVQIQKFESWMIADTAGLTSSGYLATGTPQLDNVDQQVCNPATWIGQHVLPGKDLKNPKCARHVVASLDIDTMKAHSPSFDKFRRQVLYSYDDWFKKCQSASSQ